MVLGKLPCYINLLEPFLLGLVKIAVYGRLIETLLGKQFNKSSFCNTNKIKNLCKMSGFSVAYQMSTKTQLQAP